LLGREADAEAEGQDWSAREKRELARVEEELAIAYFEEALRLYEAKPWQGLPQERQTRARAALFRDVLNRFLLVMSEARTERLNMIRTSWPELPPVVVCGVDLLKATQDEAYTVVAQTALTNRFDLLNVRAQLVDAWRLIAVQANSLLGVANVTYHVDSTSPPNRSLPFAFSGDRTRHQLIMDGELPLVRRFERATYRATLIAYQRQRRQLQAAEDFVLNDVRIELRSLRVLAEQYKIQQRQLELAYSQVENSLDVFRAPPVPTTNPTNAAGNAAALTQQLLNAQRSLPQAQNALYTVWINYLVRRLQLYRDLELMPLDARGVWIDELSQCQPPRERTEPGPDADHGEPLPAPRTLPEVEAQAPAPAR
jgi:hypothetical protein